MKIKVALCLPWYAGADRDCVVHFLQFQHYLGRLQERLYWQLRVDPNEVPVLPKLDPVNQTGFSEIPPELVGTEFEFGLVDEIGCSLPGLARERCVENALKWGADFLLFYDADMIFGTDLFLRLFLAKKPVVAALAFTGREPITPVIYRFDKYSQVEGKLHADVQPVFNYLQNTLQQVDAVGSGVFLVDAAVFKTIPKPWFYSTGLGEDIFFCLMCKMHGVEVWVDTSAKTLHKPTFPKFWHDEMKYLENNPHLQPSNVPTVVYAPAQDEELAKEINAIGAYIINRKAPIYEGSSTLPQLQFLANEALSADSIVEVGFNAGMSATAMLLANPKATLVSFDEAKWDCVPIAKEYVDNRFPGRHALVSGDSVHTLPEWAKGGPEYGRGSVDLAFIDGGHDFPTAWSDISNLAPISKRVIMDDYKMPGVKAAIDKAISEGLISNVEYFEDPHAEKVPRRWLVANGGAK